MAKPRKKATKKTNRKKGVKKWSSASGASRSKAFTQNAIANQKLGFAKSVFAPNLWVPFNWGLSKNYISTGSFINEFNLNSLYDPDYTAITGRQPRYYDTLVGPDDSTAPYFNYRVHAFSVKCSVNNLNGTPVMVSFTACRSTATAPATIDEAVERPDTVCRYFGSVNGDKSSGYLKLSGKVKNYLGHKDLQDVDGAAADYAHNPSEIVRGTLRVWAVDGTSVTNCNIVFRVIMYSQLYTLNDVADS